MTSGNFDGGATDQIVTAFREDCSPRSRVCSTIVRRGSGIGESGLTDQGVILKTSAQVTALTHGDYDKRGKDALVIALWDGAKASVKVDDTTVDLSPHIGRVTAMTSGDVDGDGTVEIVMAVSGSAGDRIYVAKGSDLTHHALPAIRSGTVLGLAAVNLDGNASNRAQLVTALSNGEVWVGDGTTAVETHLLYHGTGFDVPAIAAGRATGAASAEFLSAFVTPNGGSSQIWTGDHKGLTSRSKLYEWPSL
jgi:hypothetical protein